MSTFVYVLLSNDVGLLLFISLCFNQWRLVKNILGGLFHLKSALITVPKQQPTGAE